MPTKGSFVQDRLKADIKESKESINRAWRQAGNKDTISRALIGKVRSEVRKTAKITPPHTPNARPTAQTTTIVPPPDAEGEAVTIEWREPDSAPGPRNIDGTPDLRFKENKRPRIDPMRLDRLESKVDDLIFDVMGCIEGDQIPALLRQVRRLVIKAND